MSRLRLRRCEAASGSRNRAAGVTPAARSRSSSGQPPVNGLRLPPPFSPLPPLSRPPLLSPPLPLLKSPRLGPPPLLPSPAPYRLIVGPPPSSSSPDFFSSCCLLYRSHSSAVR